MDRKEPIFDLKEHLGVIFTTGNDWTRELNVIWWSDKEETFYDLRDWSPDHERMTRGVRLSKEGIEALVEAYEEEFLEEGKTAKDIAEEHFFKRIGNDLYVDIFLPVALLEEKDSVGFAWRLCVASWNDGNAKFDIRKWSDSYQHMSRGMTLTDDEMKALVELYRAKHPKKEVV